MKLIILLLISFNAHAYFISESDFESCKIGGPHVFHVQAKNCKGKCIEIPNANCPVFDLVDEEVPEERWSGKFSRTPCKTVLECEELGKTLCDSGKEFFYAETDGGLEKFEAYCAFRLADEMVKTGRKVLKVNEIKKAEHLAVIEARRLERVVEQEKEAKIQAKIREIAEKELAKEIR